MTGDKPSHTIALDATEILALAEEAKTKLSLASNDQSKDMSEQSVYVSLWPDDESEKVALRNRKHGIAVFANADSERGGARQRGPAIETL